MVGVINERREEREGGEGSSSEGRGGSALIGGWSAEREKGSKRQFGSKIDRMHCLIRCGEGERKGREKDGPKISSPFGV